jgi:molecular chaperone GrpE
VAAGGKKDSGRATSAGRASARRPRRPPVSAASREAQEDSREQLDDLDEDLAVEQELGIDPDSLTGEGGLEVNSEDRPIIRDNRKVDPVSGRPRAGTGQAGATGPGGQSGQAGATGPGDQAGQAGVTGPGGQTGPAGGGRGAGAGGAASSNHPEAAAAPTPGTAEAAARALEDEVIAAAELIAAREEVAARTEDLRRLGAEYANYRKRVDRDRSVAGDQARAEVLTALAPTLDDIDAARAAGDLEGPFKAVAEKLEAALGRFGMERYGAEGDVFDPTVHEALLHQADPAASPPKIFMVMQPGYRMGERVLRAARVGVVGQER